MSFTCPRCWRTSYHPDDEQYGYCGSCDDFTGAINGNQRYSSGSTSARSEREMRMQPNDEEPKAKPDMPEVPRNGISGSLRDVQWERMEPQGEPPLRSVSGSGVSGEIDDPKPYKPYTPTYPSIYRFHLGALGLGIAVGITWTLAALNNYVQRRIITKAHAIILLYAIAAAFFIAQVRMLFKWNRALKKDRAELAEQWDNFYPAQGIKNPFKEKI